MDLRTNSVFVLYNINTLVLYNRVGKFTAWYMLSSYIKHTHLKDYEHRGVQNFLKRGYHCILIHINRTQTQPVYAQNHTSVVPSVPKL